jgi:DNA invertase Pin-like site-specific DNA recombinase
MERVLGVIRLSVMTDESTSPERQRAIIESAAKARGAEIVDWAIDLDVSASSVRPADRPELGKRIADPVGFDTMMFWRVDRLCRKVGDFSDMIKWAEDHGKNLVSATESFDLSSPLGKAIAYIVAVFAELESATIRERVLGAHNQLRKTGRWPGGRYPYGYMPEKREDGVYLVHNPETKPVLAEIVRRMIAGEPMLSIARDLNERAVPPPHGARSKATAESPHAGWSVPALRRMCMSESLLGMVGYAHSGGGKRVNGRVVPQARRDRRDDGMIQLRAEPLLTQEEFDQLQEAIAARAGNVRKKFAVSPLSGSLYCPCGQRLYRKRTTPGGGKVYWYYVCSSGQGPNRAKGFCGRGNIRAEPLEREVHAMFMRAVGDLEVMERIANRTGAEAQEVEQIRRAMRDLGEERDLGLFDYSGGREQYLGRMKNLKARLDELILVAETPEVLWRPTGKTYGQLMAEAGDDTTRVRDLYALSGVRIVASVDSLDVEWPENLVDRMRKAPQPATRAD